MMKTGELRSLTLWGTGKPRREFLHADDCAEACLLLMRSYSDDSPINVGAGEDIRIVDLARLVCEIVGVEPRIEHDLAKPDGAPRKLLDVTAIRKLGFVPSIELRQGIMAAYDDFVRSQIVRLTALD
jgi:GDP-L-fucose synthase